MSILQRVDRIIFELKEIPKEPEFIKHKEDLQPLLDTVLKSVQDFGNKISKMSEDEEMMKTLNGDIDAKIDAYSFASKLTAEDRKAATKIVMEGTKSLPTEEELHDVILKSFRDAPVEDLIRAVYSEADVQRVGAITQPNAAKGLQYTEGMKSLKASYDNPDGIEDLTAQAMKKVENSPESLAKYFKMFMGI